MRAWALEVAMVRALVPVILLACSASPGVASRKDGVPPGDSGVDTSRPVDTSPVDTSPVDTSPVDSVDTVDSVDSVDTVDTAPPWSLPARADLEHPTAADSWAWGGGFGYPDAVDPTWPVVTRVSDLAGLQAALSTATAGAIVYVEDDAAIDLTGLSLCIPGGVWLAGGRGSGGSPGGLLYATVGAHDPVLQACGDDVRVTGLRIRGPDPETCPPEWPSACPNDVSGDVNCAYCTDTAYGIATFGWSGLEVDNNELSGWTYAGVGVKGGLNVDVHHNHIHNNWREGLGYGVVVYGTPASATLIRWNRFDAMRHAVAGQGYPDEDYEARNNLMGAAAIGHIYDMHGQNEATGDGSTAAGGDIRVHDNIVLTADQYSFVVRGKPVVGAWFYDNCVAPPNASAASKQRYFTGNFYVDEAPDGSAAPNAYGQSASDCGTLRWCLADAAIGPLRYGSASGTAATDLLVGDLDGDGRDDVFGSDGSRWRWANPNGGTWASLATSAIAPEDLALADLDGDGVDDVIYANGTSWRWSRSGSASWATLRSSTVPLASLRFGDFDGDGQMDIFTTDGRQWSYYPSGSGAAVNLATATVPIEDLAVADLDGDGIADVFYADGAQWRWSRSGTTSWADLARSGTTLAYLRLADIDGDRIADVLAVSGSSLVVSLGGRTSWSTLRHQVEGIDELRIGDFDGDGRADLLTGGCL